MTNIQEAEKFLEHLGGDHFVFQTFTDDKTSLKGDTDKRARVFTGDPKKHWQILQALNGLGVGVFVQINEGSKRGKSHITKIRFVFIDLDNPAHASLSVRDIRKYMPQPTISVKSSTGKYHFYWRVRDCSLDQFKDVQVSLAETFRGDPSVTNLDRVMRLPGFMHNKREPVPVTLLMCNKVEYSIKDIVSAIGRARTALKPIIEKPPAMPTAPRDSGNIMGDYGTSSDDGVWSEGDRTQKMISRIGIMVAQGSDADYIESEIRRLNEELCPEGQTPKTEASLQQEVFPAIEKFIAEREAQRAQMEPQVKVKKSVPPAPLSEVPLPPSRAPEVPDPPNVDPQPEPDQPDTLELWISRYLYVEDNSRVIDTHKRGTYGEYTLADFKNKTANIRVPVANGGSRPMSTIWLTHSQRRTVRDTYYKPCAQDFINVQGHAMWNLYAPSEVNPVSQCDPTKIRPFIEHLMWMFPIKQDFEVIMCFIAYTLQHPEERIPWAPLIKSMQGVGKGFIYHVLAALVGIHNATMIGPERIQNQFNSFLFNTKLVCIDEMKSGTRFDIADRLKTYISEKIIEINEKGVKERPREVFCNILIFTNHANATVIENDDRRFWVYEVPYPKRSAEYYTRLWNWMKEPQALNHLHRYFLDYDLSNFNHAKCPDATAAKLEMIASSKSQLELDIMDAIDACEGIFAADIVGYNQVKQFAQQRSDGQIIGKAEGLLRQIWGRLGDPLRQVTHAVVPLGNIKAARQRLRCIRHYDHWKKQTVDEVRKEFTRSVQLGIDPKKAMPPNYMVVKGDDNEESNRTGSGDTRH